MLYRRVTLPLMVACSLLLNALRGGFESSSLDLLLFRFVDDFDDLYLLREGKRQPLAVKT